MFPLFINAYSFNVLKVDTNLEKVNQLKICLNNQDRICFFQEFPKTFNEFEILYGYSDSTGGAVFYNDYPEHLNFLFSDIDSDIDFRKIIEICLEGKWDADAVNMFQSKTRDLLLNYNRVFLSTLFKFNKKEQESFWYFIFDGPHRNSYGNRVFHEALLNQTKVFYPEKVEGIRNKIKLMILTEEKD
jgi:hypothetical protein